MSSGWTAPGAPDPVPSPPAGAPGVGASDPAGPQGHGGPADPVDPSPAPGGGPSRELQVRLPLFPLRPLGLGEILGAAVRIYRLQPRPTLALAAAVHGVSIAITAVVTGASMIPMVGELQAMMEDPSAEAAGMSAASDVLSTLAASLITLVLTLAATAIVTGPLTRIAIDEAVGDGTTAANVWAAARRLALPSVAISLLTNLAATVALLIPAALGALPMLLGGLSTLGVLALLAGIALGVLAALYLWIRLLFAIPVLAVERTGILGSMRRSLTLTAGRRLWRVLGIALLLTLAAGVASQVVSGVFGTVGFVIYFGILLASSMQAMVAALLIMTVITMIGAYIATVIISPFMAAGTAALYADARIRHEAWDVELGRRARENQGGASVPDAAGAWT